MYVILISMLKKASYIFISLLLLQPLFVGVIAFSQPVDQPGASFQKPCDMDHCDMDHSSPNTPKCPLCPAFNSFAPYLSNGARIDLPAIPSSFILVSINTLSDQEVVKAIFHPPTSNS
jgi:hypothetical protein